MNLIELSMLNIWSTIMYKLGFFFTKNVIQYYHSQKTHGIHIVVGGK